MTVKRFAITVLLIIVSLSSFAIDYYTATTTVNVRSGAGANYSVSFTLNTGEEVEVIFKNDEWYNIKYNGKTGYASSKYLRFSRTVATPRYNDIEKNEKTKNPYIIVGVIIGVILLIIFLASSSKKNAQPLKNISSPTITQQQSQSRVIVTKSTKSSGLAIFLAIIFPYFGVLYATISGFFWLFFSYIGMWGLLFYWGLTTMNDSWLFIGLILSILHWLISIIWAGVAANDYNKKISSEF